MCGLDTPPSVPDAPKRTCESAPAPAVNTPESSASLKYAAWQFEGSHTSHVVLLGCLMAVALTLGVVLADAETRSNNLLNFVLGSVVLPLRVFASRLRDQAAAAKCCWFVMTPVFFISDAQRFLVRRYSCDAEGLGWVYFFAQDLWHPFVISCVSFSIALPPRVYVLVALGHVPSCVMTSLLGFEMRIVDGQPSPQPGHSLFAFALPCTLAAVAIGAVLFFAVSSLNWAAFAALQAEAASTKLRLEAIEAREAALKEVRAQAEECARVREGFIAALSHDFGTPIAGISLGLDALQARLPSLSAESARLMRGVRSSTKLLKVIRQKALDVQQMRHSSAVQLQPAYAACSVREIVDELRHLQAVMPYSDKVQEVQYEVEDAVPQYVLTDGSWLLMGMVNLLGNAFKHAQGGGVAVRVNTRSPGMLRLEVTDTGRGVPAEVLPNLFRPFAADFTSRCSSGTGLGLYHVAQLAKALGGRVGHSPNLHTGSVFYMTVPFTVAHAPLNGAQPHASQEPADELRDFLSQAEVLLVEDSPMLSELVSGLLTGWGARSVLVAADGESALRLLIDEGAKPAFVLTDLRMPVMDGYQLMEALRRWENANSIRPAERQMVIAFSADAHLRSTQEECRRHGVHAVLGKAFRRDELWRALKQERSSV